MSRARQEPIQRTRPDFPTDGIFVVGMFASGVELLGEFLARGGLGGPHVKGSATAELTSFNGRLLAGAGGTPECPPEAPPTELARKLDLFGDEARRLGSSFLPPRSDASTPWVWADPRLGFLTPFWAEALGIRPAVILVHRDPGEVAAATDVPETVAPDEIVRWWDRLNRAALILCSQYPSYVVSWHDLVDRPKVVLSEIVEFLESLGIQIGEDLASAVELVEPFPRGPAPTATDLSPIEERHRTLDRLLQQLDGRTSSQGARADLDRSIVDITADFYDEDYYGEGYDKSGVPYSRSERFWVEFFARVAKSVSETLNPESVLDAGCAIGMLVEALRNEGIDARGIDISQWAIGQVPGDLKPYCSLGSVTEEIVGDYDLITCIEVLEHLPPSLAELAVANLCRHARMVLFASTPDDFDEPTHLNVEPSEYWASLFLRHGFVRDFEYDASFLAPHAILFRALEPDPLVLVRGYERALSRQNKVLHGQLVEAIETHDRLADRYNLLADDYHQLHRETAELDEIRERAESLADALDNAEKRRLAENAASFEIVHQFELGQRHLAGQLAARDAELIAIRNTKTFRYSTKLRAVYGRLRGRKAPAEPAKPPSLVPPDGSYQTWIDLFDTRDEAARRRLQTQVLALPSQPKISVIMPVYNPPVPMLRSAIESVIAQIYPNWELCIADDCSTDPSVAKILEEFSALDERVKVVRRSENGHISAASNSALSLATGQWVAPLDHDDVLSDNALALVACAISEHPDTGLIYSDEDKIDEAAVRQDPFFKPDFDPLLLAGQNYISHLTVCRKELVDRVGGYREGYEGSQDWDLVLRVIDQLTPDQVLHIPHVLYHWRVHSASTASLVSAKPYAVEAGRRAVQDHLERVGASGDVVRVGRLGHNRVCWSLPDPAPKVSVIVPTRDGRMLSKCIDSVLAFTIYPNFEVVVVDNSSRGYQTLAWLKDHDDRITVLRDERPFNFAAINNFAVARTSGDIVCLLNDDTEVMSGEWLTEMVSQLLQPGVGAVGAKLLYENGSVQHAGVILGVGGVGGHAHRLSDRTSGGYFGNMQLARRVSAVTAACMTVRREAWEQVNGMDEVNLPVAFNDVDLCLRLREAGWEIVWTPYAQLTHYESISRGPDNEGPRADAFALEVLYMEKRWGFEGLREDKYYNPNLTLNAEDYSLAWPPRKAFDPKA